MAPKHDEIIKPLGEGWAVAWDTTQVDPQTTREIARVAKEQAAEFGRILEVDLVMQAGDKVFMVEAKTYDEPAGRPKPRPRRRSARRRAS
jgi:hypothetical protein